MCEMELWNEKVLPVPPINTCKTIKTNIDIKHMYNVFKEGKKFFVEEKYMHAEYAVLSRIVYRMKQKFRSAKDFKALEKLGKALDNYFKMDITSNLQRFMELIPSRYKDELYLPTKNLLDYILVRLQGLAKLMERIVETSKIAAYLLDKRMHTGHFWKIAFITFSLVSRVYVLARYTAKFVCDFYRKLLPFSNQLSNLGKGWLPKNYTLPKDLMEWLNVDWLEFDDEIQIVEVPTEIPDIMKFFDLVDDDDDVQFCDEYFMVDDDEDTQLAKDFKINGKGKAQDTFLERLRELRGFDNKEDIGEIIPIEDSFRGSDGNVPDHVEGGVSEGISETMASKSVGRSGDSDNGQISQTMPVIDLIENEATNKNPTCDDSIIELIDKDKSITLGETLNKPSNDEPIKEFSIALNKNESNENILPISDSDSDSSINEDTIVTISDASLTETPGKKVINISEQNDSTINLDSDEDVITIPDTPLVKPTNRIKQREENSRKIKTVDNAVSKVNVENIIVVPDTPALDTGVIKKKIKNRTGNLNSKAIENKEEESVIILDTPLKALSQKKDKVKIGKVTKKVNKLKAHIKKVRFKDTNNLEEYITPMAKVTKGLENKISSESNNGFIQNNRNSRVVLENSGVLRRKRQNKIAKSKKQFNTLKNQPGNLNTEVNSTSAEVNSSPRMPLILKKKHKKHIKNIALDNRYPQNKTKKKPHQNYVSKKKHNYDKKPNKILPTNTVEETISPIIQTNVASGKKIKKKKRKVKEINQSGIKYKQVNSPRNSAKNVMNKNSHDPRYFIKLQSETSLPLSNPLSTGSLSKALKKRKRYWEYAEEAKQANVGPNKKKRKNNSGVRDKSLTDVASRREIANVPSDKSRSVTVVKQTKSQKRKKKINKAQAPQKIGGKVRHDHNNYYQAQAQAQRRKGFKHMRADKRKKEYKRNL